MGHGELDKVILGPTTGRAEVMAAIDGLAEKVAHLALRVKRIVSIPDAERYALEKTNLGATLAATDSNVQVFQMAEELNFPLSPQQGRCVDNTCKSVTELTGELAAKLEAAFPQLQDANCPEENAVAARVAELHDRLGGFLESSFKSA